MTIVDAAEKAIRSLGGAPPLEGIYETIIRLKLYTFNTDVPHHVLRTQIHRYCENVTRVDNFDKPRFNRVGDDNYIMINERSRQTAGIRRIHRAKDKDETIKLLVDDLGVFREIWRLLLFAAMLGAKAKRREKLQEVDSGRGIDQSTFGNSRAWPGVLHLLSLVEAESPAVLSEASEEGRIELFEEYANGGLAVLREHFELAPASLQSLVDLTERFGPLQEMGALNVDLSI